MSGGAKAWFQSWMKKWEGDRPGGCNGCAVKPTGYTCGGSCGSKSSETAGGILSKNVDRREMLKMLTGGAATTGAVVNSVTPMNLLSGSAEDREKAMIDMREFFKTNYRLMTEKEQGETVERLERKYKLERNLDVKISTAGPRPNVLYGYAFNISKCKGYRECIRACIQENNQDRASNMQYIRIFEKPIGSMSVESGSAEYSHEVPAEGHFYMGTQCFQCDNPPCVRVCPTGATWKEQDGIVVIDYDWCIGCRYCQAACPYWARRFNWKEPTVPNEEVNPNQHYLGNRLRKKGVMEKCTYCIQRTRQGRLPACAEACPTGARTFGNLLDPDSEIRYILAHKKVFRLKEDLNTEPKFWYYMD